MTGRAGASRNGNGATRRPKRTPPDEARRRGLSRVAPITAGIVLAGSMVSVSTAVALAATRDTSTTGTGGSTSTTTPAGTPTVSPVGGGRTPAPSGGGLAPAGNSAPQGQSQGS